MMNQQELLDLIQRMGDDSYSSRGDQTTSWYAHRDAETLNETAPLSFLSDQIRKTKSKDTRSNIYFIVSHIGRNTNSIEAQEILFRALDVENNKYVLSNILDGLCRQNAIASFEKIIQLAKDDRWLVRHSAIEALSKCSRSKEVESALLEIISKSNDKYDVYYALISLYDNGSDEAVPHLIQAFRNHKDGDIKGIALRVLTIYGNQSLLPIYVEALQERSLYVRICAIEAILIHGDETAIGPVCRRVKKLVARKRKTVVVPESELIIALRFLRNYEKHDEYVKKLFREIVCKHFDKLQDEEQAWLKANFCIINI